MERIITSLIVTLISGWMGVTAALTLSGEKIPPIFAILVIVMIAAVILFYYSRKRKN